ncbi:TetR/AcrR family transcriptional regulator [Sphingomonas psychrotolerans]|uniref:TetR/AcrR family transcriptional regulator n=1 Tax=Sphingomonas psychrotolerans TaxID=1327635 RepID=A0ABU3N4D8_9SPHN|nr:TetR/AcrR family transcriptional regulator [Sphingomonas psychrotolerans]MDT8759400.1 TetR/AcrR family transcriptional regulator [Sphingomonas psychrotolerans]
MTSSHTKRRKRSATEARDEALAAARTLLLEKGPAAVTLASVGRAIAMSHPNVIHHFGSAAGLQTALMETMIRDLAEALGDAVSALYVDAEAPARLVDRVFDAFGKGGAGQLAAWLVLARELNHFESLEQAVTDLVAAVRARVPASPDSEVRIRNIVLLIAVTAFGDALIGPHLRRMLGQEAGATREVIAQILPLLITPPPAARS